MGCETDVMAAEGAYQAMLGSGPVPPIEEDRLNLTAPDGRALIYRAG